MPEAKRLLAPEDLGKMNNLAWLALSPDGAQAAFSVFAADEETGRFHPHVYTLATAGGPLAPLGTGGDEDQPRFAPAGKTLAFLGGEGEARQVWLREENGEPRQLTHARHGVQQYAFSPDGAQVVFEAKLWPGEEALAFCPMTVPERAAWRLERENSPVAIEELMYKFDEDFGVVDGSAPCIGVADVKTGEARMLTGPGGRFRMPAFSPDGTHIACYGAPYGHHRAKREEVFLLPAAGGVPRQLTQDSQCAGIAPPVFTPGGAQVVYAAYDGGDDIGGFLLRFFRVPAGGGEAQPAMPADDDIGVDNAPSGRTSHGGYNPCFQPARDGRSLYYTAAYQGANNLYRLALEGVPAVEQVPTGAGSVHAFCPPEGGALLYSRASVKAPADGYLLRGKNEPERLTQLNAWLSGYALAGARMLRAPTADEKAEVQGWVMLPPGHEPGAPLPGVLNIHGGPTISFVDDFNFEFQVQAAAGLAVVYCNPRGSSGYGLAFTDMSLAWGQESYDDLFTFLNLAIREAGIDPARTGVTGGSYGGHMTLRILGRPHGFRAAVAQRSLCNLTTSYGTGDMGFLSGDDAMPAMMDFFMQRAAKSPLGKIDRMKTPLLILHGTCDYRCSFEQAEQLFIAMKDRNPEVPVRLVAFPGENHNVSRTGLLHNQIAHMGELVGWFRRFLQKEVADDGR